MIVRNEGQIITRMLDTVCELIDSFVICDTGSSDETIQIIETYMKDKNIPGVVIQEPFRNFEYNRNFALAKCAGLANADYILLLDADMILEIERTQDIRSMLSQYTAWYVFQGSESFHYKNIRFIKNNCGIRYCGVTHEYIDIPDGKFYNSGTFETGDIFIRDLGDGGCKSDKYERDIRLLEDGLKSDPYNQRYTFYLGNSYRDIGNTAKAIELYKRRAMLGGWIEEVWYSHYEIGRLSLGREATHETAIYHWLEAYNIFPERIENIYEIVKYYRIRGKCDLASLFYQLAKPKIRKNPDFLFVNNDIYDHLMEYEFSIIGYYKNPDNVSMSAHCMKLIDNPRISNELFQNIMSNYKFYKPVIETKCIPTITLTNPINDMRFIGSTPSICFHNGSFLICQRFVNYFINESGGYNIHNNDHSTIETVNVIHSKQSYILKYDTERDVNNRFKGIEDIRLFSHNEKLLFIANRPINDVILIEFGEIDTNDFHVIQSKFLKYTERKPIEKNWVLFEEIGGCLKCVYSWYPLIVGNISDDGTYDKTHSIQTPASFRNLRGSTNGISIGDEIWFLCHSVSYEEQRYYYHMMVVIDYASFRVKRYTPLFVFEGEKIEYTLGMTLQKDEITIGYSVMDRETKFTTVAKSWFDDRFISAEYVR